ncbi:MAG: response regulator transcription factor [Chloroflexi bacterium]|nr:response regulator transcription factor [Chloroflexota bacterium]
MSIIRVLIADDHAIVREGLRTLIRTEPGMKLVGEASDGIQVVDQTRALQPDVIVMDLLMPRKDGLEAINEIVRENPQARILVLTSYAEDDKVYAAVKAGALGYLLKDSLPKELLQAIRDVYRGEPSLHPSLALRVIRELKEPPPLPPAQDPLTVREVEVLKLVAQGLSNQGIAEQLKITEWTVTTHVRNILDKLHLANRTQAALYALREGIAKLK